MQQQEEDGGWVEAAAAAAGAERWRGIVARGHVAG